jgi:tetratricopeptide (TPR) repeat protein
MTAIDMAERQGDYAEAEALRERIASLPDADEQLLVTVVDYYAERLQFEQARQFIERALETNPKRQRLLVRMGDLLEAMDQPQAAITYYDQAVRLGTRTDEGKTADKRLARAVPVITDRERGSVWLAMRETLGFVIFGLVLAWQDAGLNLMDMGLRRWVGVVLGFVGGYLLITATSSPQQDPIASWLGGDLPENLKHKRDEFLARPGQAKQDPTELPIISEDARYVLGFVGVLVLALAFALVFHRSLGIVIDNPPPYMPWSNLQ